ncbi:MAG: zinc metalloprotease HtpX [Candidatus Glassbacteria bacterium]
MGNHLKTTILLASLTALIILIGRFLGGQSGMVFAFLLAALMNLGSYWFSDRIVLAMYRAREVSESEEPGLHSIVRRLSQRAGIPMPRIHITDSPSPNAFATGRDPSHAAVAVTRGLLEVMGEAEIEGVLAHELAHVKNRDILISSVAATLAGAIMIIASMARWAALFGGFGRSNDRDGGAIGLLITAFVAPIAAMLIQLAISRSREFQADYTGAKISGNPRRLASALKKLAVATKKLPMRASPSTAHMFIVNPLAGGGVAKLFSTHPPLEERIARLERMAM